MANVESTALVAYDAEAARQPRGLSIISPLVDPQAAVAAMDQYEALKSAIVQKSDIFSQNGRTYLKKKFWRRLAYMFGLSLELVAEVRGHDESGHLFYKAIARAIAPNGRYMDSDGYCSTAENGKGAWREHDIRATASTRAKNRAISDLVGGGEVTAEEVGEDEPEERRPAPRQPVRNAPRNAPPVRQIQPATPQYKDGTLRTPAPARVVDTPPADPDPDPGPEYDEADTIPYSLEDDAAPVVDITPIAPDPEWKPAGDVTFVQALKEIGIKFIADIEQFVQDAKDSYPNATLREACRREYARRFNAQTKAAQAR